MDTENSVIVLKEFDKKSNFDKKRYRIIRLANGMKAMLVHDGEVHADDDDDFWPSFSLAIDVGSSSDPSDLPGLAKYVGK